MLAVRWSKNIKGATNYHENRFSSLVGSRQEFLKGGGAGLGSGLRKNIYIVILAKKKTTTIFTPSWCACIYLFLQTLNPVMNIAK